MTSPLPPPLKLSGGSSWWDVQRWSVGRFGQTPSGFGRTGNSVWRRSAGSVMSDGVCSWRQLPCTISGPAAAGGGGRKRTCAAPVSSCCCLQVRQQVRRTAARRQTPAALHLASHKAAVITQLLITGAGVDLMRAYYGNSRDGVARQANSQECVDTLAQCGCPARRYPLISPAQPVARNTNATATAAASAREHRTHMTRQPGLGRPIWRI
ncbi:arf-GAP with GTPase, ANK repeat and PH domain-containing protein 1-like protein [Lates japonicus]|uniref:Arf-GAP with GTPase, ANK repeat and PH domain-containing protein 1-like protein n=1 Tax=Lates japonicus TaxID=270547 RepID=A0AAD3N9U0_LATJO|nr:arf-GAP with GTPase, ANK repeat and PH domain-containing protein 1-like protein [Lates japonicus]